MFAWFEDSIVRVNVVRRIQLTENLIQDELAAIIRLLKRTLPLKELPRTGWIMEGAGRGESDSVAAYSYCVALLSYMTARQLGRDQRFKPIDLERVLAMATLHDLAESVTGELATGFKARIRARGHTDLVEALEEEAVEFLLGDVDRDGTLAGIMREFDECQSKEAKIVKFADIVDAFAHAKLRLGKTFNRYLDASESKLRRGSPDGDCGVGGCLADWLGQIREEWDTVSPLPVSPATVEQGDAAAGPSGRR